MRAFSKVLPLIATFEVTPQQSIIAQILAAFKR